MGLQLACLEEADPSMDPLRVLPALPKAGQIPTGAGWLCQVVTGRNCSQEATSPLPPSKAWLCSHISSSLPGFLANPLWILSFSPTCDWRILSTPRSLTRLHRPPLPCLYLRCTWLLLIQDHFSFDCRTLEEFKGVSLLPSRLQSKPFWIPVLFKCSPPSCSCRHGPVLPSLASRGAIGPVCQGFYWVPWTGRSEGQENNKGSHSNPPWLTLKRGFYC